MDNQLLPVLETIYDILYSISVFGFIYGVKAISWATHTINTTMNDDGWLTKVFLTVAFILAGMQAMRMIWRGLIFWIRLLFRLTILFAVIGIVLWLSNRGVDGAVADARFITEYWLQQYQMYEKQASAAKTFSNTLKTARDTLVNQRAHAEHVQGFW